MKKFLFHFIMMLFGLSTLNAQDNSEPEDGYILTEIWKAKPDWYALTSEERRKFFEEKIHPVLGKTIQEGAEIVGTAVNNNTGPERMDYQFMAVWRFPDKESSDQLEKAAKEAGFLKYFDQVNFSGNIISPPALDEQMIKLTDTSDASEDFQQAIQAKFQEMIQAMANSKPKLVANHFTEDALLKFPGLPPVKGRKAIAELHEMMIKQGISVRPTTTEVEHFGDTGYEIGTFELVNQEGELIDTGTYATVWKKIDGEWKLHRDVVSSSTPRKKE